MGVVTEKYLTKPITSIPAVFFVVWRQPLDYPPGYLVLMNWEHLIERAVLVSYTNLAAALTSLLVLVFYFSSGPKSRPVGFLALMAGAYLLQTLLVEWLASLSVKTVLSRRVAHDSLYVYLLVELVCCLLFIRWFTRSAVAKKVFIAGILLFIPYTFYYWLSNPQATDFSSNILTVEGFLIILACVYFFFELLTGRPDQNLFTEPAFWSISGMLVLFTVITPVFLLVNYFIHNREALFYRLYMANNLCYSLLFLTFSLTIYKGKKYGARKG
jgi:hypothetical protein